MISGNTENEKAIPDEGDGFDIFWQYLLSYQT